MTGRVEVRDPVRQNMVDIRQNTPADVEDAGLTSAELANLGDSLRSQRRLRQGQLAGLVAPARPDATARMVLADVEAALERMGQGRYGWCGRCARPIGLRLLEVVPQARYCAPCARSGRAVRR